jgi:hypothetical protein
LPFALTVTDFILRGLAGPVPSGSLIQRARWRPSERLGQKIFVCGWTSVRADVGRRLRPFVRTLIFLELSLHVDAIHGIVDAVLIVSEITHRDLTNLVTRGNARGPVEVPRSGLGTAV